MLICNSHDNADWYEEEGSNGKGEQETIPWEVDRVVLDNKETNSEHGNKRGEIPNDWSVFVAAH